MSASVNVPEINTADLQLAKFQSKKELCRANSFFRKDKKFTNFPWATGPLSLVAPSKAILLLKTNGLKFYVKKPIKESDLTPKQNRSLDEDKAILFGCWGAVFFLERISSC